MKIIFHGQYENTPEQNERGVVPARMMLSEQTLRDDITNEVKIPEGALWLQIWPSNQ